MASKEEKEKEKRELILLKSKGSSGEPLVTKDNYVVELTLSLSWHNIHTDIKTKKEWLKNYLIYTNSEYEWKLFNNLSDFSFNQVSVIAHIILIGGFVSDKHKIWLSKKIGELASNNIEAEQVLDVESPQKTDSREKYLDLCVDIDEEIDSYIRQKSSNFSMKSFIAENNINGSTAKKISTYYQKMLGELLLAQEGSDKQLEEGYSCYSKAELKKFIFIIRDIVESSLQAKVTRAPRAKKEKPVSVIVKDVQYLKEFPSLNMVSVPSTSLHNSKEIWMYNTENKKLFKYKADGNSTLMIKGKYIKNYSITDSYSKTIRKPEDFFKHFTMAKVAMSTAMKEIKAVESKVNGKIYPENILLKVF